MNRFFKIKAIIALICIILALCLVSIGIAIKISITTVEKKDNIVRVKKSETFTVSNDPQKSINVLKLGNAKKLQFYFNGLLREDFICYAGEKGETLLPLDLLFKELNIRYKVSNPDDAMVAELFGKALVIKFNSLDASYGGEKFKLNVASVTENGHIFVSIDALSRLQDLIQSIAVLEDAVFLNCWSSSLNEAYKNLRLLKLTGNKLESYYISGKEVLSEPIDGIAGIEEIYPVPGTRNYIIKAGSSFYTLDEKLKTKLLSFGSEARLSETHKQIYWTDNKKKRLYIYDIKAGKTKSYKNHFARIAKNNSSLSEYNRLYDYTYGSRHTRFDFIAKDESDIYTVIERNGKVVVEGKATYSPDGSKLVYYIEDKGFYTANSDGTEINPAGIGFSISWIDNDRFLINSMSSVTVFDTVSKSSLPVDVTRALAGTASNGDIFSIRDNVLYVGAGMEAKRIFRLPWSCDYIYAPTGNGPYIILSGNKNSVYCFSGNSSFMAAETGKFINNEPDISPAELFLKNSAVTPGEDKIAFLQNETGLLQVNLLDLKNFKLKKVVVDCRFGEQSEGVFELLWLDETRLLLHSGDKGWVLDLREGTHVYSWDEAEIGSVLGILTTK